MSTPSAKTPEKTIIHTPPADVDQTSHMGMLLHGINARYDAGLKTAHDLHQFSIDRALDFWSFVVDDIDLIFHHRGDRIIDTPHQMTGGQFFTDSTLNFAENLLRKTGPDDCLIFRSEDKIKQTYSWDDVHAQVSQMQQYLSTLGVKQGDVVAGFVPNSPQVVIAMLATTALGGIWTSCSPDFGVDGVVDRFGSTKPKVLFTANSYYYNGKCHDSLAKVAKITTKINSIEQVIVFEVGHTPIPDLPQNYILWDTILQTHTPAPVTFVSVPFNAPVFILYSSGTTGKPKCIVHGAGGGLLSLAIEGKYHCDISPGDRVFYYTTCGWMMWNWLVGQLVNQATLLLYDGAPIYPEIDTLFDYIQDEQATFMGVSAKYVELLKNHNCQPKTTHDLSAVRMVGSTGSVLSPDLFSWITDTIKENVYVASLSGGTDIMGCFMGGTPLLPVHKGELVSLVLGKAVEIWDDNGTPLTTGIGELVCVKPFPTMPLYFWNDTTGEKYRSAYFEKFPGIWCHGDYVERTDTGYVVMGRSDTTLNPGGVRIGTAEIYNQIIPFDTISDCAVIGQPWYNDTRIVLFVVMKDNQPLTEDTITAIKQHIKTACTPRHVPAKIIAVPDLPRTRSGKISEICILNKVTGKPIKNLSAIGNPECLDDFVNIPQLSED